MASSEGVAYRWEAFNRWCDEYADRHQGMKPKVEDVRRWHRENAEKVWPDSNERPSVFLAVSHNKGRRVRGHKTCEYYKRYRAGKAAEQQLAARLQPAALSGRRILAVTAAARKLNTDGSSGRGGGGGGGGATKRLSPNHGALGDRDLQDLEHQPEKRPRLRNHPRPHHHPHPGAGGNHHHHERGRGRGRSSSEDLSDDPSWASSADMSDEDDSGSAGAAPGHHVPGTGAQRNGVHGGLLRPPQPPPGVHITVVHRDADGRTVHQLQATTQEEQALQQLHQQASGLAPYASQQGLYVTAGAAATGTGAPALACLAGAAGGRVWDGESDGGKGAVGRGGGYREAYGYGCPVRPHEEGMTDGGADEEQDGADKAGMGTSPPQRRGRGSTRGVRRCSPGRGSYEQQPAERDVDGGEEDEQEDEDEEGLVGLQGAERRPGSSQVPYSGCGWRWGPHGHPGVAPRECRAARSSTHHASQQQEPRPAPHFSGYVGTPVGSMPVYHIAARSRTGGGAAAAAGTRRGGGDGRLAADAPSSKQRRLGCGLDLTPSDGAAKDPLDLLAQAACEALASPRPVYGDQAMEPGAPAEDVDADARAEDQGSEQRAARRGGGYQSEPRDGLGRGPVGRRVAAECSDGGAQGGLAPAVAEQHQQLQQQLQQQPQQQRVEVKTEVEAERVGPPRAAPPTEKSERCCGGGAGLAPGQGDITRIVGVKAEPPAAATTAASDCFSDATRRTADACTAAPAPACAAAAQPHRVGAAKLMPPSPDACAKAAHSAADAGSGLAAAALVEGGGGRAAEGEAAKLPSRQGEHAPAAVADCLAVRTAEVEAETEAAAMSSVAVAPSLGCHRNRCRRVFQPADEVASAAAAAVAARNASGGGATAADAAAGDGRLMAPRHDMELEQGAARVAAANAAAANIAGAAVAAALLQQQQQQQQQQARVALDTGVGCCPAVPLGSALAAIAAAAAGDAHCPASLLPPALPPALWTALSGGGVAGASTGLGAGLGLAAGAGTGADMIAQPPVLAAAATAATAAGGFVGAGPDPGPAPMLSEGLPPSLDYTIGGQLLPVVRLLQMQMAAGLQDSLAAGGDDAGVAAALQAAQAAGCLVPPSLDLGALVGGSAAAAPHSMLALARALQQSR